MFVLFSLLSCSLANLNCLDSICSSCIQGYKYALVACVNNCPEGSSISGSECAIGSKNPFIDLNFAYFLEFTATHISDFQHPQGLQFNDSSKLSPIPTKERGFYFSATSSLVSNKNWVLGPMFYLNALVRITNEGQIFWVGIGNLTYFSLSFTNNSLIFNALVQVNGVDELKTFEFPEALGKWIDVLYTCNLELGKTSFKVMNTDLPSILNAEIVPVLGLNYTIGNSFTGFIYELMMGNSNKKYYASRAYPISCEFNQFYNNNLESCQDCPNTCSDWPWCIGETCQVCFSDECLDCDGFGFIECTLCKNSYQAPYCNSPINCLNGTMFNCTVCQDGFANIEGICISEPYLYGNDSNYPVFNIKFREFKESYGDLFTSGSDSMTYAPFNNRESDDPYPVYKRGLYFNSTTYLKSSQLISLNLNFTFASWLFMDNYTMSTVLYSSKVKVMNSFLMFIRLSSTFENRTFTNRYFKNNMNYWSFMQVTVYFYNDYQNVRVFSDFLEIGTFSVRGYAFYDNPGTMIIGKKPGSTIDGFSGFIYQVILWQISIFDLSQYLNTCTEGGKSCLWEVGIGSYWNDYERKQLNCEQNCSIGCKTWGTCNQCQSIFCDTCSYYISSCTEGSNSYCLDGFLLTNDFKCCDIKCTDCYGPGYYRCFGCYPDWVLNANICLEKCPSFFTLNKGVCEIIQPLVIELEFDSISQNITDSYNGIVFSTPSHYAIWPHVNESDPIPAFKRGFYFKSSAYMQSDDFSLNCNFSVVFFAKLYSGGILLQKNNLVLQVNETGSLLLTNNIAISNKPVQFNVWTVFIFQVYSNIDGILNFNLLVGSYFNTSSFNSYAVIIDDSLSSMKIGDQSLSFIGFLWKIQIYYSLKFLENEEAVVCLNENQENCLWDCKISQLLVNGMCGDCLQDCQYGCKFVDSCSLCFSTECLECTSYGECRFCPQNSVKVGSECKCVFGFEDVQGQCEPCGAYYLEILCLNICPLGYTPINSDCKEKLPSGLALSISFDSPVTTYTDSINNLKSQVYSLIPAYMRGVYFNSTYSYLLLPSNNRQILIFGLRFYICFWIFLENSSGAILTNSNKTSPQLQISIQDSHLISSITLKNSSLLISPNTIIGKGSWYHIISALDYTDISTFSLYINGNQLDPASSADNFLDEVGGNLKLGCSDQLESFQGFIYSIESYVKFPDFTQLFVTPCENCEVCLVGGGCLWNCSVDYFYSNDTLRCEPCDGNCTEGCKQGNNCSVCSDNDCEKCKNYGFKSCSECRNGYVVEEYSCTLCQDQFYYDSLSKSCKACTGLCDTCDSSTTCLTCKDFSHITNNKSCKCIQGYYGSTNCTRKKFNSVLTISLKNVIKLIFTEPLQKDLESSDMQIKIDNDPKNFTLNKLDDSTYEIQLSHADLSKGKKLRIIFLTSLVSKQNSLLDKESLEISLNKQQSKQISETLKFFKQNTKSIFMSSVGATIGLSIINFDPNCLFTFLNSAELFTYTLMYELELDQDLHDFLANIQISSNLPTVFDAFNIQYSNISDSKLNNFGYYSNLIWINSGFYLTLLIFLLLINCLLFFLTLLLPEKICIHIKRCLKYFKYKIYLRFWLQTFFEFFIDSIITIRFTDFSNLGQIFNFILSLGILAVDAFCIIVLFYAIYKRYNAKDEFAIKEILSRFNVFFEEFRMEFPNQWLFYCLFILRRINIYVINTNCFTNSNFKAYFIFCETLMIMFFVVLSISLSTTSTNRNTYNILLVSIVMFVLGATVLFSLASLVIRFLNYCRKKCSKDKNKFKINVVTPENAIMFENFSKHVEKMFIMRNLPSSSCDLSYNEEEKGAQNSFVDLNDSKYSVDLT